jgi:hypothetical protein
MSRSAHMPATLRLAPLLLVAWFALPGGPSALPGQEPPGRPHGEWRLDPARSDTLPRRLFSRAPSHWAGGGPGTDGPGAGGTPGTPGEIPGEGAGRYGGVRRRREPGSKDLDRMRQTMALARHASDRIAIDGDSLLTLTDSDGVSTVYRIGKSSTEKVTGGGDVETKSHWSGDFLLLERKVKGGGHVTETFRLGLGSALLLDFVEVESELEPLSFRRVYRGE